jgi:hypothetical protein
MRMACALVFDEQQALLRSVTGRRWSAYRVTGSAQERAPQRAGGTASTMARAVSVSINWAIAESSRTPRVP